MRRFIPEHDKNWLRLIIFAYALGVCFLIIVVSITGYSLSHPELGLTEKNPLIASLIERYGLVSGLFLGLLSAIFWPLFAWSLFMVYIVVRSKYRFNSILADCLAFSLMSSFGIGYLLFYSINMANDVSCLLVRDSPPVVVSLMDLSYMLFLLTFLVSSSVLAFLYYRTRKQTH